MMDDVDQVSQTQIQHSNKHAQVRRCFHHTCAAQVSQPLEHWLGLIQDAARLDGGDLGAHHLWAGHNLQPECTALKSAGRAPLVHRTWEWSLIVAPGSLQGAQRRGAPASWPQGPTGNCGSYFAHTLQTVHHSRHWIRDRLRTSTRASGAHSLGHMKGILVEGCC
jgi:hypothetical protein